MKKFLFFAAIVFANFSVNATQPVNNSAVPAGAKVNILSPANNATVATKFTVKFGVTGMKVEKSTVNTPGTGHHHLIIDGQPTPAGQVVEKDLTHLHFGGGQTEAEVTLTPGKHTLTLQFADAAHISYGPTMSQTITVNVK